MKLMDEDPQPPEEALFAGEEALHGRPPQIAPADGLRLMRDRLESLQQSIKSIESSAQNYTREQWYARLTEISREIYDTKQRLREYEIQLKSQN
jgi:hypothetical protein